MAKQKSEKELSNHQCQKCGFTYDEKSGTETQAEQSSAARSGIRSAREIKAGTKFDELPASWKCPGCGSQKSKFKPIEDPLEEAIGLLGKYYEGTPKREFEHED